MSSAQPLDDLDPVALAKAVSSIPEGLLRELLDGDGRRTVLDESFRRFPEFLDAEAVQGVDAVIGWRITGGDDVDNFAVVLENGRCKAGRDLAGEPQVTLELDAADFVRLVTGNADAPGLVLSGRLRLEGDAQLALALGGWFRVPGAGEEGGEGHLDVTAIDEEAIARIVDGASDRELRERLRGPIRDLVLEQIFHRFADHVRPDRTAELQATIAWRITGREDGEVDRWTTTIDRGTCTAERDGAGSGDARVTIRCDAVQFLKLVTGNGNPVMDFMRGRIKLKGDIGLAARLPMLFVMPSADGHQ